MGAVLTFLFWFRKFIWTLGECGIDHHIVFHIIKNSYKVAILWICLYLYLKAGFRLPDQLILVRTSSLHTHKILYRERIAKNRLIVTDEHSIYLLVTGGMGPVWFSHDYRRPFVKNLGMNWHILFTVDLTNRRFVLSSPHMVQLTWCEVGFC